MQTPRLGGIGSKVFEPYSLSRVIILGMGPSGLDYITWRYSNPGAFAEPTEVWTVNHGGWVWNYDVLWSIHNFTEKEHREEIELYQTLNPAKPIVAARPIPGIEESYGFPLHEVVEKFQTAYLRNTVAYMIAFAMLCEVKVIHLYGCDYNYDNVAAKEDGRANVEFWLGRAAQAGIQLEIGRNSTLADTRAMMRARSPNLYGYGTQQPIIEQDEDGLLKLSGFEASAEEWEPCPPR